MDIKTTIIYHMMLHDRERLNDLPPIVVASLNEKLEFSFVHNVDRFCAEESGILDTAFLTYPREMKELLDLLDGNGFYIIRPNQIHTIVRYDKHVYQRAVRKRELYIAVSNAKGSYIWGKK